MTEQVVIDLAGAIQLPPLAPNEAHIGQHLKAIAGEAMEGFIEIAYNIAGEKPVNQARRFPVGELDRAIEFAVEQNRRGSNVYTGPALRSSGGNKRGSDAEALPSNFLWIDKDSHTTVEEIVENYQPLKPTYFVTTGQIPHVRAHLYFRTDEPITDQNALQAGNKALIAHFDGDPSRSNPSSLMRIGGSVAWPVKEGRVAELTLFQVVDPVPKPIEAILRAYGDRELPVSPPPVQTNVVGIGKLTDDRKNYIANLTWANRQAFAEDHDGRLPTFDQLFSLVFETAKRKTHYNDENELIKVVTEKVQYALRPGRPPVPAPGNDNKITLTEDAIAEEYAERYQGRRIFDHDRGKWMCWDKDHWRIDAAGSVPDECRHLCRSLAGIGDKRLATLRTVNAVQGLAQNDQRLAGSSDRWDTHHDLIGVPGGVIDLRTGDKRSPDPALCMTKRTAVAPSKTMATPIFDRFLSDVTGGDDELRKYLQVTVGYIFTGETDEHALFYIQGNGQNGKSVFLNTIDNILDEYSATASMETFAAKNYGGHPTDLASLQGARMVSASETAQGKGWNEPLIKQITGGDKIAARYMRKDFFEFRPVCKLVFIGNHAPQLNSVDKAMRRRFHIVPFTHTPKTVDRKLEMKLRAEWPGILWWAIQGAIEWYANGLPAVGAVQTATEEYFEAQDVFTRWIEEQCASGPDERDNPTNLFMSYREFALSQGDPPGNQKTLAENLKRNGFEQKRSGGKRMWIGLRARQTLPADW